jgi:hypothetical protein
MITFPLYLLQFWHEFNGELKYPSRRQVIIVKLGIQIINSNFKLTIGKWVSEYKIKWRYVEIFGYDISFESTNAGRGRQSGKTRSSEKAKTVFYVDKIEVAQEEEKDGKN